jgi:hypothetical protein
MAYTTFESSYFKLTRSQDFLIEEEYCYYFKQAFIKKIPANFTEIDELLCILIDPEKKSFTEAEVNYHEFEFDAIDSNWKKSLR